ncbi:phospholipase D alpha 1-like [Arachis duranensis]|uniref:Phospholipase D n=1 Tax=Arachis duranensis TaxID=130453 RepID=A0A9C6TNM2_ARADU|nr:phospholipase D alpha 1-like [Arachis duranensis]XP_052112019.1 phospholipase D alpha 1-like [Arachis duranensis]XP_052112020.1 phospholipase D alpha 1-like [Arachis duranensis]XP_052113672.1 phospholipase D alpha 1-like [Arachis duranensis]XP_052113674.1 phospholipase D alpha 1-like [Arachis duranensis]XP_052113676.1 phospholipase D alpha 1-like [Arachis duranensis]
MAPFLLHGDINATIYETQKFDTFSSVPLYASIYLDEVKIESRPLKEPNNPKLEECFYIRCAHIASNIVVKLERDKWLSYLRGRGVIGEAYVEVDEKMLNGVEVDKWVEIVDASKRPISGGPKIHIKLQFFDAKRHQNWSQGIKSPDFPGVPRTFFSQHKGCKVTLYQDVHVLDDFSPRVVLDGGKTYEPQRCWEDIFDAINEAKHLIYITGWSLYTQISLIRDPKRPKHGGDITLGELLKKKAKEDGVKVVLLLWQDGIISVPGIGNYVRTQGTHDKETQSYFKDTNVHCILCPRDSVFYTHHQKIVVVDTKLPNGKDSDHQRRIVSFIGGIDLCNGRYDTQFHSLFQTLAVEHSKDFYQPSISGSTIEKGGPREPWHDIHCKLEGPIAWDIYSTFVQRFRKQGTDQGMLLSEEKLKNFIIAPSQATNPDDDDTWNVQLFRSIDNTAALGFPETAKEAFEHGLVSGENKTIDRSIQDAYINAIRRAKNFIYIENQYFIGSAFGWSVDNTEFDAVHLIPKELSLKIVSKIKAKEKFMVYVVIPMWPEGVPINNTTGTVQKILYLQRRTIEMMYQDIAQALKEEKIEQDPRKYLSFFCLGNREVKKDGEYVPPQRPEQGSDYQKAQEARRFMIYVHSKMMIVDDEYIIIGSANINQRSMDGGRDTEIAMGAYQPHHLATSQGGARGQIHGLRMSLWYEHLGMHEDTFLNPESEECINKVKQLGEKYWELYSNKDSLGSSNLPGHLLQYPVDISADGTLTNLSGFEFFPDTTAPILGDKNPTIINRVIPKPIVDIFNKIFTR